MVTEMTVADAPLLTAEDIDTLCRHKVIIKYNTGNTPFEIALPASISEKDQYDCVEVINKMMALRHEAGHFRQDDDEYPEFTFHTDPTFFH